mmetsp:Transcript_9501/g.9353  ORF Transcript_9501/g.9353 Transcript_9501/m.9353 type:complete len:101 (-) Transcript_9501:8-310(-)
MLYRKILRSSAASHYCYWINASVKETVLVQFQMLQTMQARTCLDEVEGNAVEGHERNLLDIADFMMIYVKAWAESSSKKLHLGLAGNNPCGTVVAAVERA